MATYYVGLGGNDGNTGLSWAQRFLTLNGAEDEPVAANDTVYVAPGVYRELLTCDVSGTAGNLITYIADVTGENTDGVGGIVRVTGSDNDTTTTRNYCVYSNGFDYRTFRGFYFDLASVSGVHSIDGTDWIVEDCIFQHCILNALYFDGTGQADNIVRRCLFMLNGDAALSFIASSDTNADHTVDNCVFLHTRYDGIRVSNVGDIVIKNCIIFSGDDGIDITASSPAVGHPVVVNHSIFVCIRGTAIEATTTDDVAEDYNTFWDNASDRTNTDTGANSETYPPLLLPPILFDGLKFPWFFGELSEWSAIRAIAGTGELSDDLLGITRPTTAAKNSWGPVQFHDAERETTTTRGASTASITLHDAGVHQIWVPVTAVSTTISVYVYREANYAGTNPRMVIKQPGQADDTTTDAAAVSQWNELTTTLTPAADPPYVVVELQSLNTAVALAYDIFFDDLTVS